MANARRPELDYRRGRGQGLAQWGEAVVAVAGLKDGAVLDLDALREFATDRLARYKLPRRLEIVAALPRNPAGKVLKFELRARFAIAGQA
jgi:fatty-acyl-CoA synthase